MDINDLLSQYLYRRPTTLRAALDERYNADALRRLAQALGVAGPTRKSDVAAAIAAAVLGPDSNSPRPAALFTELTDIEQAAIAEALYDPNHSFDQSRFQAKYGSAPDWPTTRATHGGTRETKSLFGVFLLPGKFDRNRDAPFIPDELVVRLRTFVPEPRKETLACLDAPLPLSPKHPLTIVETDHVASTEIFSVLQLIDMGRVQVSAQTHRPSAKATAVVRERLVGGDFYPSDERQHEWEQEIGPIRAFAWPVILQAAGLASVAVSKLALTSTAATNGRFCRNAT